MIDFTPLARQIFAGRLREAARFVNHGDTVQREELDMLLQQASRTEIGIKYGFGERMNYAQFRERVPLHGYEELRSSIDNFINLVFHNEYLINQTTLQIYKFFRILLSYL